MFFSINFLLSQQGWLIYPELWPRLETSPPPPPIPPPRTLSSALTLLVIYNHLFTAVMLSYSECLLKQQRETWWHSDTSVSLRWSVETFASSVTDKKHQNSHTSNFKLFLASRNYLWVFDSVAKNIWYNKWNEPS